MNTNLLPFRWRNSIRKRKSMMATGALEKLEERTMLSSVTASIDGVGNNELNEEWGATDTELIRLTSAEYSDGISTPAGEDRPSAREVSNALVTQETNDLNAQHLSDIAWIWGQFIDHDIDLTENGDPLEAFDIEVPLGDSSFDPDGSGDDVIDFNRSVFDPETGTSTDNVRQQINQITAFIDGSVVYGSDEERAAALRTFQDGKLKTSEGDLLPFNDVGLENAGGTSSSLFLAGDIRANENAALTSMHTIFVREHNRLADEIAAENPSFSDEQIYQEARRIVTAEIQAITYNEFLPALLGEGALSDYIGYDSTVNPGISNIFSTTAYRLGHSLLSSELLRLDSDGSVAEEGNLSLSQAFFAPQELTANGIDSILQGAAANTAQELDTQIVDDVRNFLFGAPGAGGFDLASLNIQRGRDHGLPDYNQARVDLGLAPVTSFADITSDVDLQQKLEEVYGSVDNIDVWVGGLAEDHVEGSNLGELVQTVLVDQFTRLRDGDRLWYQNQFDGEELLEIETTTLADIIERNSDVENLQTNVFYDPSVFYYKADANKTSTNLALRIDENRAIVRDIQAGQVVAEQPLSEISKIKLVGANNQNSRFVVDLSESSDLGVLDIDVYANGNGDQLVFRSIPGRQQLSNTDGVAFADQVKVNYQNVERVIVQSTRPVEKSNPHDKRDNDRREKDQKSRDRNRREAQLASQERESKSSNQRNNDGRISAAAFDEAFRRYISGLLG
ncbi:peroxidase [Polystyrenella longa]|uniref:Peroxidase n=2 Tax=Polystyrenella longa TaxID=2528007 RepID=A0A518CMC1_9PLAN|nr:peroxidase [Polystyrenella longa]